MCFSNASVESRRRCSLGWDKAFPRGRMNKFGYEVGTTTSRQFTSCFKTSEKPSLEEIPNVSRNAPRRRSPSINRVRAPESAMVMARLADMFDFPSFGTRLVTRGIFGTGPSKGRKNMDELEFE